MYILSQVLAAIAMFFNIFSRIFKKQSHSMLINIISNIFSLFSCILLTAYMGMVGLIVSIIRSLVFYYYSKNDWEKKLWLLLFFVGLQFVACLTTSIISGFIWWDFALIFLKSALFSYGCWQHNIHVFRAFSIASCILTIIYFLLYAGYVNALAEFISILILTYLEIKERKNKNLSKESKLTSNEDSVNV